MIKKIGVFMILCAVSLLPWAHTFVAPSIVYSELIWLIAALLSTFIMSVLIRWSNRKGFIDLDVWDGTWKKYIGPGFILGIIGYGFAFLVIWLMDGFAVAGIAFESLPVIAMVLVYTLYIALSEEFIFRGYVLASMQKSFSLAFSILGSTGLFILYHFPKLHILLHSPYAVLLIAAGLLYAFAYIRTRSIWLSVGMHWGWNMGVFSLMSNDPFFLRLGHQTRIVLLEGHQAMGSWFDPVSWVTIVVMLLLLILILKVYGKPVTDGRAKISPQ